MFIVHISTAAPGPAIEKKCMAWETLVTFNNQALGVTGSNVPCP